MPRILAVNSRQGIRNAIQCGVPEDRLCFLPNVVDVESFAPGSRNPSQKVRFLSSGRLVKLKRFDLFLRSMATLHAEMPGFVDAQIVGEGPERQNLERLADTLHLLPDVVQFTGATDDMARVYRSADVVVLCSDWEGTPNVLLEALACGLPVIASDVGGVSEIVKHGENGFLVPPGDVEQLVEHARRLAQSPQRRAEMGRVGRILALNKHSPDVLQASIERLFERALA
jgi:glycosyltransferase involved in cell wall biosynthesis